MYTFASVTVWISVLLTFQSKLARTHVFQLQTATRFVTLLRFSKQFRGAVDRVVRRHGITGLRVGSERTETHAIVDRLLPGVRARNLERKIQQMIDIVAD